MRRLLVLVALAVVVLASASASSVCATQAATQGRWVIRDLGTLGGPVSVASDINDRGQVLGWSWTKSEKSKDARGFLWDKGRMVDLGAGFSPAALNNHGQIVGSCGKHACVWESGTRTVLDEGKNKTSAIDINERQQIVGWKRFALGGLNPWWHVILWTYKP